jgi:hypothetical protein
MLADFLKGWIGFDTLAANVDRSDCTVDGLHQGGFPAAVLAHKGSHRAGKFQGLLQVDHR